MSIDDLTAEAGPGATLDLAAEAGLGALDLAAEAAALLAGLVAEPWGQVSASVYETGRLVTLAPWLTGHDRRVAYLLSGQRADGGWGALDPGYALGPTLSATEALLTTLSRTPGPELEAAVVRALDLLRRWLGDDGRSGGALTADGLPDMPAIELIVPSLLDLVNQHLGAAEPGRSWSGRPLRLPAGLTGDRLGRVRALVASGAGLPAKLHHVLEIAGPAAHRTEAARPEETGTVGASAAATATWLGDPDVPPDNSASKAARGYLEEAVRPHGGPVPVGLPVTVFERAWVVSWLARAGVELAVPAGFIESLGALFGPAGTPAAAGLPADADTTAGTLYALTLLGAPREPGPLSHYDAGTHFCTWQGEDGRSITTNAHVLEAFGGYAAARPETAARQADTVARIAAWLREQQRRDGSWLDRWHVSPYYATACAAIALDAFGGPESTTAVRRSVRWLLATQQPDGSWGVWEGTAEETAYAVQTLLLTSGREADPKDAEAAEQAALRGCARLLRAPSGPADPPLWHDKDLYRPAAIIRAAELAALHLATARGLDLAGGPQYSTPTHVSGHK